MTLNFRAGTDTHVGRVRSANQDTLYGDEAGDLFVVADGMGGHNGGEVASRLAVDTVRDAFNAPTTEALVEAIQSANEVILAQAEEDTSLRGMGTTVVALASVISDGEERIAIANVGDSRCYLLEDERLRQITKDHSVVQTLVDNGQITRAEAEHHPQRNILTRALGIDPKVMTDSWELLPFQGDRYLLCSDGLFNEVSNAEIVEVLRRELDPNLAAAELVRMANEGGGRDNISVVIVDVVDDGGRKAEADDLVSRVAAVTTGGHRAMRHAGVGDPGGGDAAGGDAQSTDSKGGGWADEEDASERKGLSFRTIAFVGALVAVVVTVIAVVTFASRSTYFVKFDDGEVTIYQGQEGGFLGIDPSVKERTGLQRSDIPASFLDEVEEGKEFSSLEEARDYVDLMKSEATGVRPPSDVTVPNDPDTSTPDGTTPDDTTPDDTTPDDSTPGGNDPTATTPPTTEDDRIGGGIIGAVLALSR